jgi:hypothetical protein
MLLPHVLSAEKTMHELTFASGVSSQRKAALLCLAAVLFATGCKSKPAAGPDSNVKDDATLTQAVQGKISGDSSLGNEPIEASVQQGVATLTGTVSSDAARGLAASDAAQVDGIRTVVNDLIVQPSMALGSAEPRPVRSAPIERPVRKPKAVAKPSAEDAPLPAPPPPPVQAPQAAAANAAEAAPLPPPRPAPTAPVVRSITLDSGTTLPVRITQTLDSATAQQGQTFSGVLASDILSDGMVVLPQGTPVSGRVTTVQEAAHFKGNSLLTIELTSLDRKGDHLPIATDSFSKAGNGRGKNSAEKIGGGAAIGAILGGIFGGGKGAAIGAAAGGGAGTGVQAATRGQQVQIESETLVRFHLSSPISVRVPAGNQTQSQSPAHHDDPDLKRHE